MNNEWYVIKDLESFISYSRILVYSSYGKTEEQNIDSISTLSKEENEELDNILTVVEATTIIKSLVKKQKQKHTKKIRYIINDDIYISIIQSLGERITSNILRGLVSKGIVEMAFDEEKNDFIFWTKNN